MQAGETADLMVLTKQSLDALTKDGNATAGTDATFASSGMGSPKPDISTPDAFKQALLNAKAIAYSDPVQAAPVASILPNYWSAWALRTR
jgi:molybdate transport system substrate-binding protein